MPNTTTKQRSTPESVTQIRRQRTTTWWRVIPAVYMIFVVTPYALELIAIAAYYGDITGKILPAGLIDFDVFNLSDYVGRYSTAEILDEIFIFTPSWSFQLSLAPFLGLGVIGSLVAWASAHNKRRATPKAALRIGCITGMVVSWPPYLLYLIASSQLHPLFGPVVPPVSGPITGALIGLMVWFIAYAGQPLAVHTAGKRSQHH